LGEKRRDSLGEDQRGERANLENGLHIIDYACKTPITGSLQKVGWGKNCGGGIPINVEGRFPDEGKDPTVQKELEETKV